MQSVGRQWYSVLRRMLMFAQILHLLVIGMLCRDSIFIRLCFHFKQVASMKRSVIEAYKNIINLNFHFAILRHQTSTKRMSLIS